MQVACFCGAYYKVPGTEGTCPSCGRHHSIPTFRKQRSLDEGAVLRAELDQLLQSHGVLEDEPGV